MSLLKIVPAVIALGTVAAVAVGVVTELLMSDFDEDVHYDENTRKDVLKKMKACQNELARFSDLKILNDKRESTSQVKNVDLLIDGVEINELISQLEEELTRLTAKYNKFNAPKKRT